MAQTGMEYNIGLDIISKLQNSLDLSRATESKRTLNKNPNYRTNEIHLNTFHRPNTHILRCQPTHGLVVSR